MQILLNTRNKTTDPEDLDKGIDEHELFTQAQIKLKPSDNIELTEEDIFTHALVFFGAGYETSANLLSHLLYALAVDEKCQQKLYEELKPFNGVFDYECLAQLPYLEACIAETLRRYSPIPFLMRIAAEDYHIG